MPNNLQEKAQGYISEVKTKSKSLLRSTTEIVILSVMVILVAGMVMVTLSDRPEPQITAEAQHEINQQLIAEQEAKKKELEKEIEKTELKSQILELENELLTYEQD